MIKIISYLHPGAPVLSGTEGALINLLDTVLVTGFGNTSVAGITSSGLVATVTIDEGVPFREYDTVEIVGASPEEYNGVYTVFNVVDHSFQVTLNVSIAAEASGVIYCKSPSLGWEFGPFSDIKVNTYKSPKNQTIYKVDDNKVEGLESVVVYTYSYDVAPGECYATVSMFEELLDINNGVPTQGYYKQYVVKSFVADSGFRPWYIIGDDTKFYLLISDYSNAPNSFRFQVYFFGEFLSFLQEDIAPFALLAKGANLHSDLSPAWITITSGFYWDSKYINYYMSTGVLARLGSTPKYTDYGYGKILRNKDQEVGYAPAAISHGGLGVGSDPWGYTSWDLANVIDGMFYYSPIYLLEDSAIRGRMPGLYKCLQAPAYLPELGVRTEDSIQLADHEHFLLSLRGWSGAIVFDVTGPWE